MAGDSSSTLKTLAEISLDSWRAIQFNVAHNQAALREKEFSEQLSFQVIRVPSEGA